MRCDGRRLIFADLMKTDFVREKALFQTKHHTTLMVEGKSAAIKRILTYLFNQSSRYVNMSIFRFLYENLTKVIKLVKDG